MGWFGPEGSRDQAWAREHGLRQFATFDRLAHEREMARQAGGGCASALLLADWFPWLILRAVPWLLVACTGWSWLLVSTARGEAIRDGLRVVFPDAWVVEPGGAGPPYVGAVFGVLVLGLFVAVLHGRRVFVNSRVGSAAGRLRLYAGAFAWSVLLWVVVAVLPIVAMHAGWLAAGNSLALPSFVQGPSPERLQATLVLSTVGAVWAAAGSARRVVRRAEILADQLQRCTPLYGSGLNDPRSPHWPPPSPPPRQRAEVERDDVA